MECKLLVFLILLLFFYKKDKSFFSLISNLLEKPNQTTYIIVVRDYLVEDFLEKFGLKVVEWEEF